MMRSRFARTAFLTIVSILFYLIPFKAEAGPGGANVNPLPTSMIFPVPMGILFPSINCAAGVNPAGLANSGKVAAVEAAYSPGKGSSPQEFFGGLAMTSQKMGVGLEYLGDSVNGTLTNNAFAGAGFKIDPVNLGIGLRDFDVSGGVSPDVDVGLITGEGSGSGGGNGLRFGFVFYNLNRATQLDGGIGFSGGKKYNMEVNLLLPPFSQSGGGYVITVQGNIFAGDVIGLNFRTSYWTSPSTYQHTIGLSARVGEALSLFAQFSSPPNGRADS